MADFTGTAGADNFTGDDTHQTISGLDGADNLFGGNGNDTISGGNDDDVLRGDNGTDSQDGGDDSISGGDGHDFLEGGAGDDTMDGGAGGDRVSYYGADSAVGVTVDLTTGAVTGGGGNDVLIDIEHVSGSQGNDSITGSDAGNLIVPNKGVDTVSTGNGDDLIQVSEAGSALIANGGAGTDTLGFTGSALPLGQGASVTLASGVQTIFASPSTTVDLTSIENLSGTLSNDTLTGDANANVLAGTGGADELDGGDGDDTLLGDGEILSSGTNLNGQIITVSLVTEGGAVVHGNDSLLGGNGNDTIVAGGGADLVWGEAGNDSISGGAGRDVMNAGAGDDTLDGGDGIDRISFTGAGGPVSVNLSTGGASGWGTDSFTGIEQASGSNHNDTLIGTDGDNWLWGLDAGAESISAGGGNDLVQVGAGDHTLDGGAGLSDTIGFYGASLNGLITVDLAQTTTQNTGVGSITLQGFENVSGASWGGDTLIGDANNNILAGWGGSESLSGGDGDDRLLGDGAIMVDAAGVITVHDTYAILSGATFTVTYNDTLVGGNGADTLVGGQGDDRLVSGVGADVLDGGAGVDTADFTGSTSAVRVNLTNGTVELHNGTTWVPSGSITGVEHVTSSNIFWDRLDGDSGANSLSSGGGHDGLFGHGGNDTLVGGAQEDYLVGGAGDDILDGGADIDRVGYFGATTAVNVDLRIQNTTQDTGGGGVDTLIDIEHVSGTRYNDTLTGNDGDNWVWGGSDGTGVTGNDVLSGGNGNDLVQVGNGTHTVDGGNGVDTLSFEGNGDGPTADVTAGVNVSLAVGAAQTTGGVTVTASGFENLSGSRLGDTLTGNAGDNVLAGHRGNDSLAGGDGNDRLLGDGVIKPTNQVGNGGALATLDNDTVVAGGADTISGGNGADQILGGDGADSLMGDAGNDTLWGGNGNDTLAGGAGVDLVQGEDGDDMLIVANFTVGGVPGGNTFAGTTLDGGAGFDYVGVGGSVFFQGSLEDMDGIEFLPSLDPFVSNGLTISRGPAVLTMLSSEFDFNHNGTGVLVKGTGSLNIQMVAGEAFNLSGLELATGASVNIFIQGLAGNDTIAGSSYRDVIETNTGADSIVAGGGDDTIRVKQALGQTATFTMGAGRDAIAFTAGHAGIVTVTDFVAGEGGDDLMLEELLATATGYTTGANPFASGHVQLVQNGADTQLQFDADGSGGGGGWITIAVLQNTTVGSFHPQNFNGFDPGAGASSGGSAGNDSVTGTAGPDTLAGDAGNDTLAGLMGGDSLSGGIGNDHLQGGGDADTLNGGAGNDMLTGGGGNDAIDGGDGVDMVLFSGAAAFTVDLSNAGPQFINADHGTDTITNVENVGGAFGDDSITGSAGANLLTGEGGHDTLSGAAGDDTLLGGLGEDVLNGGGDNDVLRGDDGLDTLSGGAGADLLTGGMHDDSLDGGDGGDRASYNDATTGVNVSLAHVGAQNTGWGTDTLVSIEHLTGSNFNDTLTGDDGDNWIWGTGGSDEMSGGNGADLISVGNGNHTVVGGEGADTLGFYSVTLLPSGAVVNLNLTTAQATNQGSMTVTEVENLSGTMYGGDTFTGNALNNVLAGWGGSDSLAGGDGDDTLLGDGATYGDVAGGISTEHDFGPVTGATFTVTYADTLSGGNGADSLVGGGGNDSLDGGAGADTAAFSGARADYTVVVNGGTVTVTHNNGGVDGVDTLTGVELLSFSDGVVSATAGVTLPGSDANDSLSGGFLDDSLSGGNGNDNLVGNGGGDTLSGGNGNDTVNGAAGNDVVDGGDGVDMVVFPHGDPVHVDLSQSGPQTINGFFGTDTITNVEQVSGSPVGNDTLIGSDAANLLMGQGGHDSLSGGGGDDLLWGGVGNDVLNGGAQATADFALYNDAAGAVQVDLSVGVQQNTFAGGHDTLIGIEGVVGGNHNDTLISSTGANTLNGGAGADLVFVQQASGQTATVTLGAGVDTLETAATFAGAVIVTDFVAGAGGDMVDFEDLIDQHAPGLLDGGANPFGTGHLRLQQSGADTVLQFDANGGGDAYVTIVTFQNTTATAFTAANLDGFDPNGSVGRSGTAGNDTLTGGSGPDTLAGLGGDDNLAGADGNDQLDGGDGNDFLTGWNGDDTLLGGSGGDLIAAGAGADSVNGGAGFDRLSFDGGPAVNVDLAITTAQATNQGSKTIVGVEAVSGTTGNDTLAGDGQANWLWGHNGGNDDLSGRDGDDALMVGAGAHTLSGGAGADTVVLAYTAANGVVVDLTQTAAQATGLGSWTITGVENVSGTVFGDTLAGDGGNNTLAGLKGSDVLTGGAGADTLWGDGQIGPLNGGITSSLTPFAGSPAGVEGGDTLTGGNGNDTLDGGGGSDVAIYSGARSAYTISIAANGTITVTHNSGGADGVDTLTNVELLQFTDGTVASHGGENLTGTSGADSWQGGNGADTYAGEAGADSLRGGAGNDQIAAGDDNDLVRGEVGNDTLSGGNGADVLTGGTGDDSIDGGDGVDRASYNDATNGVNVSLAVAGAQATGWGADTLTSIEHLTGSNHNDTLTGNDADNWIWTTAGTDSVSGGNGGDLLTVGYGHHTVAGGAGVDTLLFYSDTLLANGAAVNLGHTTAQNTGQGSMTITGVENVVGQMIGGDTLSGDAAANVLGGWGGSDSLSGGGGNDRLLGDGVIFPDGSGVITTYDIDTDPAIVQGSDTLNGGAGADTLIGGGGGDVLNGGAGDDVIDGGAGTDVAVYADATAAVTVSLAAGTATGGAGSDTLTGVENLNGSNFGDTITGSTGNNNLFAGGGNDTVAGGDGDDLVSGQAGADTLRGEVGADTLNGGTENDLLIGGPGNDSLDGGLGVDTASYADAGAAVTASLATGQVTVTGLGTDTLTSIEGLIGSSDHDSLTGDGNANVLEGGAGNDSLDGGAGNDLASYAAAAAGVNIDLAQTTHAVAGLGTDTWVSIEGVIGSAHADTLTAGAASATLDGGAGADEIVVATASGQSARVTLGAGADTLRLDASTRGLVTTTDFEAGAGGDVLDIMAVLQARLPAWNGTDNPFEDGYMRLVQDGTATVIQIDNTATDAWIDFMRLENTSSLSITAANLGDAVLVPAAKIVGGPSGDDFGWTPDSPAEEVDGGAGVDEVKIDVPTVTLSDNPTITKDGDNLVLDLDGDGTADLKITNVEELVISILKLILSGDFTGTGLAQDTIHYVGDVGGVVEDNLLNGTAMTSTESIDALGRAGKDTLIGANGNDRLDGGDGEDNLSGRGDNDTLIGGAGNDVLDGGDGSLDVAVFTGNRADYTIVNASGTVTVTHVGGGSDGVDTLTNIERLQFADTTTDGVGAALGGGGGGGGGGGAPPAGTDGPDQVILGFAADNFQAGAGEDSIFASTGDDFVHGNAGADTLSGGEGNDTLRGGQGADALQGDLGTDLLFGDLGDDQVFGGAGDDIIEGGDGNNFLRGGEDNDVVRGGADFDDAHGNMGNDSVYGGGGGDWVVGGQGQDMLFGDDGHDVVLGNLGEDTITGNVGNDVVRGGQGNDIVNGDVGDDWLSGDRGDDTVTGGAGADIFHSWGDAGVDRVLDFNYAEGDRVNLLAGTTYTVAQVGADTVITMTGGAQMTLTNVQHAALADGWITVG